MWAAVGAAHVTGSARRRRERRLRAYLRYARMSVQMALAEASHHTAPRGQWIARAREEERETKYTAAFRATVPPPEPELFDLFEEPGGGRPDLLLEPQGPQAGIQRHTMEHIADVVPMVQILDIPVSLGADQLVEVGRHLDFLIPEQVIEVPKISLDMAQRRRMVDLSRPPQTAEQLVDVPTIISYSLLRTVEQSFHIPVPRVRVEGGGGLQGFRPGQGSPAVGVEQIVEFPVPLRRRKRSGDVHLDRFQQRFLEQITSTLLFLTVVEEVLEEVFTASPRDRAQQRFVEQNMLTLLFLMVVLEREVFALFPEDSIPQRLPVSRPSFLLVEVFKKVFKVEDRSEVLRTRLRIGRMEISTRRCWLKRRG